MFVSCFNRIAISQSKEGEGNLMGVTSSLKLSCSWTCPTPSPQCLLYWPQGWWRICFTSLVMLCIPCWVERDFSMSQVRLIVRLEKVWALRYPFSVEWRPWSDRADLSLCCVHMWFCWFLSCSSSFVAEDHMLDWHLSLFHVCWAFHAW